MTARRGRAPVRGYGITPWGRAFVGVVEAGADHRHVTGARRYFRDHHVDGPTIAPGQITSSVRGSQLDPFEVILTPRVVDPVTVVELLRASGEVESLLALARGEQPAALGELIAPTESADVASSCTCPDEAPRCIHVLATAFEVAAQIDRLPVTLLRVMGTDLPDLLALARDRSAESSPRSPNRTADQDDPRLRPLSRATEEPESKGPPPAVYYGDHAPLPPLPAFSPVDALTALDTTALRAALRASGVGATQLAEALDDLAELYAVLRDRGR
ncbi:MAG: hypothetical protein QM809_09465 [Gordonia sp. (in: high G+C Gram-positive bacteria)]|uniref:hypothetical protein n=1 Tax=Gordonia sp. (in: high G+C Gram-positive bacteria) TaxID=84139 RepID=UPI0039E5AD49